MKKMVSASAEMHGQPGEKQSAFTLVELLVVIGIIAMLIAILLPSLHKARQKAYGAACLSNQRQIVAAIMMYANEYKGTLPGPCLDIALDPWNTNAVNGQTVSNMVTWGGSTSVGTQASDGVVEQAGTWNADHNITSMNLLQRYLGGPGGREVWFCPASDSIRNIPCPGTGSGGGYHGKQVGYGYRLNNDSSVQPQYASSGAALSGTSPSFLFGYWVVNTTANPTVSVANEYRPKKLTEILAGVNQSGTYIKDPTRVWLIIDSDCRNYDSYWSGTFGMVTDPSLPSEASEVNKNKLGYQCMHTTGPRVPYDGGRNFGFLDGHAEYLGYNDMPGYTGVLQR